jgi:hypothetical protein
MENEILENWSIEEIQNVMKHHYKFDDDGLHLFEGKYNWAFEKKNIRV